MDRQFDKSVFKSCGIDVFVSARAEFKRPWLVEIGNHVAIDSIVVTTAAKIGDYTHIAPFVSVIGGPDGMLIMEHFTVIAAGSRIICGSEEYLGEGLIGPTVPKQYHDTLKIAPVVLKMFACVATNVVVFPGVTLAEGSVIGAGSIVTKDTGPWTMYAGTPARPFRSRPKEKMIRYAKELGYQL